MSFTLNNPDLSFNFDLGEDLQRESIAGDANQAPTVLLPTPQMRKQRLDQSRSRGSTPVSTTRSLNGSSSPATNIDDLIPASILLDDTQADTSIQISAQFSNFSSQLADRDQYRKKVPTQPGFSQRDWVAKIEALPAKSVDLPLISADELSTHNTQENGYWIAIHGNVYDITEYINFHPGGASILLDNAGKDGTSNFTLTHSFVNHTLLLGKYQVGYYLKP